MKKSARTLLRKTIKALNPAEALQQGQALKDILVRLLARLAEPDSQVPVAGNPLCPMVVAFVPGTGEPAILDALANHAQNNSYPRTGLVRTKGLADPQGLEVRIWDGRAESIVYHPTLGIGEPSESLPLADPVFGLVLVPGLGFGRNGSRLGKGGGYYDRFLAAHPGLYRMGVAFDVQVSDTLPVDPHDMPMDALLAGDRITVFEPQRQDLQGGADFFALFQYLESSRRT